MSAGRARPDFIDSAASEPAWPERLWGPHGVELPSFDDDWFRFFHALGNRGDVLYYEVHEMCNASDCTFRPGQRCPFHPAGCECSLGACQA